jgi:hypothetical protein
MEVDKTSDGVCWDFFIESYQKFELPTNPLTEPKEPPKPQFPLVLWAPTAYLPDEFYNFQQTCPVKPLKPIQKPTGLPWRNMMSCFDIKLQQLLERDFMDPKHARVRSQKSVSGTSV